MLHHIWAASRDYVDHAGTCLCMCAYACVLFRKVLRSQHHRNLHPDWSLVQLLYSVALLLMGSSLTTTPMIFSVPLWLFWDATLPGTWLIHVAIRYCRFCMAMSLVNQRMSGISVILTCQYSHKVWWRVCALWNLCHILRVIFTCVTDQMTMRMWICRPPTCSANPENIDFVLRCLGKWKCRHVLEFLGYIFIFNSPIIW